MKKGKSKISKYRYLIVLLAYAAISMWIYGMTQTYFVNPIVSIGAGQYLDLRVGITVVFLFGIGIVLMWLFARDVKEFKKMKI